MNSYMRWAVVALVLGGCGLSAWAGWRWFVESNPNGGNAAIKFDPRRPARPIQVQQFRLMNQGDDHSAEEKEYQANLQAQVDALVHDAASENQETIAAQERKLPTAALPLLQAATGKPTIAAATTQPLADALAQDHVRLNNATAIQRRLNWYRKTMLDVFAQDQVPNAQWTDAARVTMEAAMRWWSNDPRADGNEPSIIWVEGRFAHSLGCGDPLVSVAWLRSLMELRSSETAMICTIARQAVRKMDDQDQYPPIRQMEAELLAARAIAVNKPVSQSDRVEIQGLIAHATENFSKAIVDPDLPRRQLLDLFEQIGQTSIAVNGERATLDGPLLAALEKSSVDQSTVLTVNGQFDLDSAWDARGNDWANAVSDAGWKLFAERLEKAAAALERAWELDPTNGDAATKMITVELGQGQGRDRMELWFKRAMQANPDNYYACLQKLYYLEPKWHGSSQEMLAFGRECLAGGNWDAGIPYVLVKAHLDVSHYTANGWEQYPHSQYFMSNPAAWEEIRSVYAEDRRHRPRSVTKELEFAQVASWYGHWEDANKMFQEVGPAFDVDVYSGDKQRQAAAEAARRASPTSQPDL